MAAPPTRWRRSRISVRRPALARYAPLMRPLWPPPMTMASYSFFVGITTSGCLVGRVVEGEPRHLGGDHVVSVIDRDLQLDLRADPAMFRLHPGDPDVALHDRRVEEARRPSDLAVVPVVEHELALVGGVVLLRHQAPVHVDAVPVLPVGDDPDRSPPGGLPGDLLLDGLPPDEWPVVLRQVADHPAHAQLDWCRPLVVVPRDRKSTRLNSSHVKISYAVFCLKT